MLLLAALASAAPPHPDGWAVTTGLSTDVPVDISLGVRLEMPGRLYTQASLGVVPRPYVQLANEASMALFPESYSEDNATLVEEALSSSVLLRLHAGWRPLPAHGWTFGGGVAYAALGGDATGAELVAGLAGVSSPRPTSGSATIEADARVLLLEVATGWDLPLWRGLVLRPGLGWSFTVWARSDLEPAFEVRPAAQRALDELEAQGEAYLDETFRRYVHPPRVSLALGWRFGGGRPSTADASDLPIDPVHVPAP